MKPIVISITLFISSFVVPALILYLIVTFAHDPEGFLALFAVFACFFVFIFMFLSAFLVSLYYCGFFRNSFGKFLYSHHTSLFLLIGLLFSGMTLVLRDIADICDYYFTGSYLPHGLLRDFVPIIIIGTAIGSLSSFVLSLFINIISMFIPKSKIN